MYDGGFGIYGILSTLVNVVLGGGFFVTFLTLRAQKKKANAEAKQVEVQVESTEIDNDLKVAGGWREFAEMLKKELAEQRAESNDMRNEIQKLRCELRKLNRGNNKIIEALESINDKNYNEIASRIKEELKNEA